MIRPSPDTTWMKHCRNRSRSKFQASWNAIPEMQKELHSTRSKKSSRLVVSMAQPQVPLLSPDCPFLSGDDFAAGIVHFRATKSRARFALSPVTADPQQPCLPDEFQTFISPVANRT